MPDQPKTFTRRFNVLYVLLIAFIFIWMIGSVAYFNRKTVPTPQSVIVLDSAEGINFTNFFRVDTTNHFLKSPLFIVKNDYDIGDVVVVKLFSHLVIGEIVKQTVPYGTEYTVMYQDSNGNPSTLIISKKFLAVPVDTEVINLLKLVH